MFHGENSHPAMKRLRAVLALRGLSVANLAGLVGVSGQHLYAVMTGARRPSERLLSSIREQLGDDEMAFVREASSEAQRAGRAVAQ